MYSKSNFTHAPKTFHDDWAINKENHNFNYNTLVIAFRPI